MCIKRLGGNCYRVLLGRNEWLQSHSEYFRCALCILDSLLYSLYLLLIIIVIFFVYLVCVGVGFPIVRATSDEYLTKPILIWLLGFVYGLLLLGISAIVFSVMCVCCMHYVIDINSEDYLLPEKTYERVGDLDDTQIALES